ncbi:MAG: DUF1501 domain-containing protein [Planctomycetes bacterium]|nr:DUF1501 domain-containing protein [Planctomycetota bacterium]
MNATRRQFLARAAAGLGVAALAPSGLLRAAEPLAARVGGIPGLPHFPAKAKRVIVLWQGGGASHVDLFDHKPGLEAMRLKDLPDSVRSGVRLSAMTSSQKSYPILPALKPFQAYGKSGTWMSSMLPGIGAIADELCLIRSMQTEAVNHSPGVTLAMTGAQVPGRPSLGAWLTYALGAQAADLPGYVVMTSTDVKRTCGQLFYEHYWGSGFIPSRFQGVRLRGEGEPVLYLGDPAGISRAQKRDLLDDLGDLNRHRLAQQGDPEIDTRIAQYEMGYQMQASVPELLDISKEPKHVLDLYGPDVLRRGSFAFHCLLARRLAERGVRCTQLMHSGWDQHGNLDTQLAEQCRDTDQPSAGLVMDLKQRGLLDDTLVVWGTEFGRTVFVQGDITKASAHGRDHFGGAYSLWLAGGGIKAGHVHGETDDFAYNVVKDPVKVHDLQATILHLMGIDHTRLTYRYQGRQFRLTDVAGEVVRGVVA